MKLPVKTFGENYKFLKTFETNTEKEQNELQYDVIY